MSKQTGLGDNLYVAGYNVSGDVGQLQRIGGGPALLEVTGIDKSAVERLGSVRDGGMDFTSFFNKAALQEHVALSGLPTADVLLTYFRGTTLGNPAAGLNAKQVNYDATRGEDGSLTFDVSAVANGFGIEFGRSLTAGVRTDTGATNGSSIDYGATIGQTSFGAQAYLQVFDFTGTDVTITVEDSTNDSAWASLVAFTAVASSPTTERVATSDSTTVDRYIRVATSTSGGFSDLDFAVMVVKNETVPVF